MGLLSGAWERRAVSVNAPEVEFITGVPGFSSWSGANVSTEAALGLSAFWCGVRFYGDQLASVPKIVYRRLPNGGKERARDYWLTEVLNSPDSEFATYNWFETMEMHALTRGNAIAIKQRVGGRPRRLVPVHPSRVKLKRINNRLVYVIANPDDGTEERYSPERIFHLQGLCIGGMWGVGVVAAARQQIGADLSREEYDAKFFKNGAVPGGLLSTEQRLGDKARKNLKDEWNEEHQGRDKAHRIRLLEQGLKYQQISLSQQDAQFAESRKWSTAEWARWLNLPPHVLKDLERATFSNIEHQGLELVTYSLLPRFRRWEMLWNTLIPPQDRDSYFVEYLVDGLLRGDFQTRMEGHAIARQWSISSANDVRRIENMNPIPAELGGDDYHLPLNYIRLQDAARVAEVEEPTESQRVLMLRDARPRVEQRAVLMRLRNRQQFQPLFEDVFQRIVSGEVKDIRRALGRDGFEAWLRKYYERFEERFTRALTPVLSSYLLAQAQDAAESVAFAGEFDTDSLLRELVEDAATRHREWSLAQIEALASEEDIRERLTEWESKRPGKIAQGEVVRSDNAAALLAWTAAGIPGLVWRTIRQNCPLCELFSGRQVGMRQPFAREGDRIDPQDGVTTALEVRRPVLYPPLHKGCDCMILPGV